MLFIHRKSSSPIDPLAALKHGGVNNLDNPAIKGKYLVLWNVDIVQREGLWHYLFEFDKRETLQTHALAQLAGHGRGYPDDVDWKSFLGPEYTVISASVRDEILNMPAEDAHTSAVITGMRPVAPTNHSLPVHNPGDWYQVGELPEDDLLLALPAVPTLPLLSAPLQAARSV
jgi:hypothetical protein